MCVQVFSQKKVCVQDSVSKPAQPEARRGQRVDRKTKQTLKASPSSLSLFSTASTHGTSERKKKTSKKKQHPVYVRAVSLAHGRPQHNAGCKNPKDDTEKLAL